VHFRHSLEYILPVPEECNKKGNPDFQLFEMKNCVQAATLNASKLQMVVADTKNQLYQLQIEKNIGDQRILANESSLQNVKAELEDNVNRWQKEIILRLAAEGTVNQQQVELEEAKKGREASIAAAVAGAQAQEQLLQQVRQIGLRSTLLQSCKVISIDPWHICAHFCCGNCFLQQFHVPAQVWHKFV
jgi:hypothetical protein